MKNSAMQNIGFKALTSVVALSILAGCSTSSKSGDAPGSGLPNTAAARSETKSGYRLPAFEEKRLANGLLVLFVPDQNLPYVSYSLLVRAGSVQDPVEQAGLASMVAELLDKGTKKRSATQIAADIGQMGADFDASAAVEHSMISASALSTQAEPLLKNMIEIVTEPTFSETEIDRVRKQLLAGIERRVDNPDSLAATAFDQYLFGSHPYARPVSGSLSTVKSVKKKHIIQHYLRYYRPNNAILSVVGKFTPELAAKIEKEFGAWQPREVGPAKFGPVPEVKGVQIQIVDKPGLVQTQIRMGHLGIKRQNEDFLALRLANTILGGAFNSRLVNRVRKDLGLTYTINSFFDARQDAGPFEISTFTKNNSVGQLVSETLKVISDFKAKGVTQSEVDAAKGYLKGVFPTAIETPEKLAFNLMLLRFYGIPDSYLTNYLGDIDRLNVGTVNQAIKKYVDDKNIKVVVYSTAAEVQSQLAPLGQVEVKQAADVN